MTSFYSVVRYVPDPIAEEAINIGVVAFKEGKLRFRFVEDWSSLVGPQASYEAKDQISIYGWARSNYLAAILVPILPIAAGGALAGRGIQRLMMILAAGVIGLLGFVAMGVLVLPDTAPLHEWAGLVQRVLILLVLFPCRVVLSLRLRRVR